MTQHLFVYGTLAPGEVNHHQLKGIQGHWQAATTKGEKRLHDPYPNCVGVDIKQHRKRVGGQVFSSPELLHLWEHLDKFEGPGYIRTLHEVKLTTGDVIEAYIYAINHSYKSRL